MLCVLVSTSAFGVDDARPLSLLRDSGYEVHLNPLQRTLTEDEIGRFLDEVDPIGLIAGTEPLNPRSLGRARALRAISRCGVGMGNVDRRFCAAHGIAVRNTDSPYLAVAELTLALMLTLLRGLHGMDRGIRGGVWRKQMGALLHGKTVGVIGCGTIGREVARLCGAFGARVIGCDIHETPSEHISFTSLEQLLAEADLVSLHLPSLPSGGPLIDATAIARMKPGSLLVNTARGDLVDEGALIEGLRSGHLGGAALDVFSREPYTGPLQGFDNVVLTPHVGSYAREARITMETQAAENLIAALQGGGHT